MMCDDARLLLHAYLDNELDAAQSVTIARHMQNCADCAASYADCTRLREGIVRASLYRRAPDALRKQWSADKASAPQARRRPAALAIAAGFAAALIVTTPLWLYVTHRANDANSWAAEAISSHIRSMQPQHLMDVVSTDQHTVKPWFAGKLDFSPRVEDLANEGFPLVGGRLDALDGHSVAALIYKRHLHVINLYQWPISSADAKQQATQWNGYTAIQWTAGDMHFVAVSDVSENELQQFVQTFRNDAATP
ncbi:anti-sigma factor family protein [Dyella flagellata]|uniref:Membrane protein n=1 Tax=Dyella flagellata TaxID=1867833 RepID=A0ABQ5XIM3_9GAMM|nr:zf-HC2 domain-containing protein [Dyella flagellata]GLQ90388.1 membrane protein [Dyella flagellata]